METSKAPMRHFCRQTCVRRSLTRGCSGRCPLPVCQSVFLFFFLSAIRADLRQHSAGSGRHVRNWVDSRRFGPNQSVSASTTDTGAELANSGRNSKKKKSCKTHRLGKNNKTLSLSQFSLLTDSFSHSHLQLSLTLCLWSLCSMALCLWPLLSVSLSPLSHSLTHGHSLRSQNLSFASLPKLTLHLSVSISLSWNVLVSNSWVIF